MATKTNEERKLKTVNESRSSSIITRAKRFALEARAVNIDNTKKEYITDLEKLVKQLKEEINILKSENDRLKQNIGLFNIKSKTVVQSKTVNLVSVPTKNSFDGLLEEGDNFDCRHLKQPTSCKLKKPKIQVIGDSHARKISTFLKQHKPNYDVSGTVMPGAPAEVILQNVSGLNEFNKNDNVVIFAGANNVYSNDLAQAKKTIRNNLETLSHPNVFLVGIPHRFDLINSSCVNKEIRKANLHFDKICRSFSNCNFVDVSTLSRECFTNHGMHLNNHGKDHLSKLLLKNIVKPVCEPIALTYDLNCLVNSQPSVR